MGRIAIFAAAAAVLLTVVIFAFRGDGDQNSAGADRTKPTKAPTSQLSGQKPATLSSEAAAQRLMEWRAAPLKDAPKFDKIDALARHLDDPTLLTLVREIGFADAEGLNGWVRSALFAEWGRRDPLAAIDWLLANSNLEGTEENGTEQAYFAVFRGWGEIAPAAAVEGLVEHAAAASKIPRMLGSDWTSYAQRELYQSFARKDANAAWEMAQARREDNEQSYRDSIAGFFRGLRSREEVDKYVAIWEPQLSEPAAIERRDTYKKAVSGTSSGLIMRPLEETIATEVAIAIGRFDLSDAWEWLTTAEGVDQMRGERSLDFFPEWSRRYPDQAMRQMTEAEFQGYQKLLAGGILDQDTSHAVELMLSIEDDQRRAETLWESISMNASGHVREFFPAPDQANRLPDYEGRYEDFLAALEAGNLQPERKESLLKSIDEDFRHKVPAAAQAHEARQSK